MFLSIPIFHTVACDIVMLKVGIPTQEWETLQWSAGAEVFGQTSDLICFQLRFHIDPKKTNIINLWRFWCQAVMSCYVEIQKNDVRMSPNIKRKKKFSKKGVRSFFHFDDMSTYRKCVLISVGTSFLCFGFCRCGCGETSPASRFIGIRWRSGFGTAFQQQEVPLPSSHPTCPPHSQRVFRIVAHWIRRTALEAEVSFALFFNSIPNSGFFCCFFIATSRSLQVSWDRHWFLLVKDPQNSLTTRYSQWLRQRSH